MTLSYSPSPTTYPSPSFNAPVWVEDVHETPNTFILRWIFQRNLVPDEYDWHKIFVDGEELMDVSEAQAIVGGLRSGHEYVLEAFPVSGVNRGRWNPWNFHAIPALGKRLKIIIPQADLATYPDFQSYLLYWDEGAGTPADTLLSEMVGATNNEFVTAELEDGVTYLFRVKMKDVLGNVAAFGSEFPATVETLPEATEGDAIAYSEGTHKATLTADKPGSQDGDCVGYGLYSNYLPGFGLQEALTLETRLAFFKTSDTLSHVTEELAPGSWMFAFRAIDSNGFESPYTTLKVNIDTDYSEIGNVPDKPYSIAAAPILAGEIRVTIQLSNTTDATHVHVYRDGAFDGEVAVVAGTLDYTYETAALVHDQEYDFKAAVANGTVESEFSETVSAVADDTGPANSTVLTIERVN